MGSPREMAELVQGGDEGVSDQGRGSGELWT